MCDLADLIYKEIINRSWRNDDIFINHEIEEQQAKVETLLIKEEYADEVCSLICLVEENAFKRGLQVAVKLHSDILHYGF